MLRYREDLRSLTFMMINLSLLMGALYLPTSWASLCILPFLFFFSYISANINHNQMHLGMFRSSFFNILVNMVLAICSGVVVTVIYLPHVVNHHPHQGGLEDWGGVHIAGDTKGFRRVFKSIWMTHVNTSRKRPSSPFHGLSVYRKCSFVMELLALLSFIVISCLFNWRNFLLFILPTWLLAINAMTFVNFALHDGCELDSALNHSRNFTSKIGNYFMLNGGYHLAHHHQPKAHWSRLAIHHEEHLQSKVNEAYQHPSLIAYMFKNYFSIGSGR